jgi:tetratricopeptide (TPR) repeat protein
MSGSRSAQEALDLVGRDPREALALADAIVADLPRPRTPEAVREVATAHRAAGLALRDLGELPQAEARLRRAVATAERHALAELAAESRMSLAYVLLERGRVGAALSVIDHASAVARGSAAARVRTTRALVLQRAGRTREALSDYAEALPTLHRTHDRVWEARLRNNRALLWAYDGDTEAACGDLRRARELFRELGASADATDALWNLGWVLGMNGEIPAALELFDIAQVEWGDLERSEQWADRAEVLLRAGLTAEASASARRGVADLAGRGWDSLEAETRLLLARCLLAAHDVDGAGAEARRARSMLVKQQRPAWSALADYVVLTSALRSQPTNRDLDRAMTVASQLRDVGWDGPAADLRIGAGVVALSRHDLVRARTLLGPLASRSRVARRDVRSRAWFARGLLDEADQDLAAADASLRQAWRVVEESRSLLGATDLRVGAATHTVDLVDSGIAVALARGSASSAFDWAERGRSSALRFRPARPPRDPELARALTRLRWAARADEDAVLGGEDAPRLRTARLRLEAEVVALARGSGEVSDQLRPVAVRDVRARVGADSYVEYLRSRDRLWAVVITARRATLRDLTEWRAVEQALDTMLAGLRRVLVSFGTRTGLDASARSVAAAAEELDRRLIAPLEDLLGPGSLVVCPTGRLVQVPWAALPSRRGRATSVAPSATMWCAARDRARPTGSRALVVTGPGLPGAAAEADDVARLHADSVTLAGERATVSRVLEQSRDVDVLHVAAHGRLRTDNPLFSSLELADGPLTGYDLERLQQGPAQVLLPSCSSGAGHAVIADETLGLAWTLMGLGTRAVAAPLLPVPDARTHDLMVRVHEALAGGVPLAQALADAQAMADPADAVETSVAHAFVSYGA